MRELTLALLLLGIAASASASGVYKWTDDKGVVHFTDRPPDRDDAVEVPGVDARPRAEVSLFEGPAKGGSEVTAEMLQGMWCEFEVVSIEPGVEPVEKRVEWDFYEGDEVQYRDLESGKKIETTFSVEAGEIVTANTEMGNHNIRSFRAQLLELGSGNTVYRLRKGGC